MSESPSSVDDNNDDDDVWMNEWANQRMDEWKKGSFENEISGNSILVDMHISQTWSNVIQNHWLCNTQEKKVQNRKVVVTRIYISKWSLFRFAYGNTNKDMSEIPRWNAIHVKRTNERAKMFYSISQSMCAALDDSGLVCSLTIALNVYVVIVMNDRWHSHDVFIIFFLLQTIKKTEIHFTSIFITSTLVSYHKARIWRFLTFIPKK